jgi:hypothetical protein
LKVSSQRSQDIAFNTQKAINILGKLEKSPTNQDAISILARTGIDFNSAQKIAVYLPIAFCRQLLPNLCWNDEYFDNTGATRKLSETEDYMTIWKVTSSYFSSHPDKDVILKIGGRCAEFHVICDLLNAGGKINEIRFTPMSILL